MKTWMAFGLGIFALTLAGCNDTKTVYIVAPDTQPPAAPRGVSSTTGDGQVWIDWYPNGESDLAGYKIWRAPEANGPDGPYTQIGSAGPSDKTFIDQNVTNGVTYFYAISAYDEVGNESPRSSATFDTPRPEGFGDVVQDFNLHPNTAGFAFTNSAPYGSVVAWNSGSADIYFEYSSVDATWFINAANISTDIQDMGYTDNFDEISFAPDSGWSLVGWVEAIKGHTYVIWTSDDHFAKVRVTATGNPSTSGVTIDWGYQLSTTTNGRQELKPVVIQKPQHDPATYLRRQITR